MDEEIRKQEGSEVSGRGGRWNCRARTCNGFSVYITVLEVTIRTVQSRIYGECLVVTVLFEASCDLRSTSGIF